MCIIYYGNFIDPDPPITEDSTMEFILTCLLNNADVIALIIYNNEVTLLLFKDNRNSDNVDEKIEYQTDMKSTPKFLLSSLSIEKEKQDLQKQIDNCSMLISKDLSIIKNKQNQL
jgi:hypothetical protein